MSKSEGHQVLSPKSSQQEDRDTNYDTDNVSLTALEQERYKKYIKMYEDEINRLHELFNRNMNMVVASK